VTYHIEGALEAGADRQQLIEAIKLGVIGKGSVTYPTARHAFALLDEHDVL
jgi:alkylhydroperoxidase/carboxymuconolactone decarboxylase family protein YurZ